VNAKLNVTVVVKPIKLPINITQFDVTLVNNVTDFEKDKDKGKKDDKPGMFEKFDDKKEDKKDK
jgi:hypothetical protein